MVVEEVEHECPTRELGVAMAFSRMDHEKVPGCELVRSAGMEVPEASGRDEDEFRELVVVHGNELVARRVVHLPNDAHRLWITEVDGASQPLAMLYLHVVFPLE